MAVAPIVRPFTDDYLVAFSAEHVTYEFDMFLWSVEVCSTPGTAIGASTPQNLTRLKNVLVESFVIHLRNVIEFFYLDSPKPSDIVAADFLAVGDWQLARPPKSAALERARVRANKEIAHLTSDRLAGSPPEKRWDVVAVANEVRPVMRSFVQRALPNRLSPGVAPVIR